MGRGVQGWHRLEIGVSWEDLTPMAGKFVLAVGKRPLLLRPWPPQRLLEHPGAWHLPLTVPLDTTVMRPSTSPFLLVSFSFTCISVIVQQTYVHFTIFSIFLSVQLCVKKHIQSPSLSPIPELFHFAKLKLCTHKRQRPVPVPPVLWQPPHDLLSSRIWRFRAPRVNRVVQYSSFYDCLIFLSIMSPRSTCVGKWVRIFFPWKLHDIALYGHDVFAHPLMDPGWVHLLGYCE